jgi:hypothetical protein
MLWILNTGAQWHMLPQSYPHYKTVHRRFQTWCRDEILRRVLTDVANEPVETVMRTITWQTVGRCSLGLLFLTAWQLKYFVPGGIDPLCPGLLFMRNQQKSVGP